MTDQYLYQNAELPQCPVETTLEVISTRWGALIVRDLLNGPLRYKELPALARQYFAEGAYRESAPA